MKKLLLSILLIFVFGCQSSNYTWTPSAEEWSRMTPMERNAWSANEMRARQNAANSWQNFWNNYNQQYQQQKMYDAQYNYYTRPYKQGGITYIPHRR